MSKNLPYLIALFLGTVAVSAGVVKWLTPVPDQTARNEQMDQVLQGIKQQSTTIATLENSLKQLKTDLSRVDAKTNQPQTSPIASTEVAATTPKPALEDERLGKIDSQLADLQQQLAALLANQNQATDSPKEAATTPDPYAGMTPEQIKQQEELASQQQKQLLESTIAATPDLARTSQISSSFEAYLSTATITSPPPQVECASNLCRFQFNQAKLRRADGEEVDPMLMLMESGAFPADGTERTIITKENAQGGLDLYVGDSATFPRPSPTL